MIDKIMRIQNGAKSLNWGYAQPCETEHLFAVGHKSYKEVHYFIVTDNFMVREVDGRMQVLVKKCASEEEVLIEVIKLLKEWFPAKEGVSSAVSD